MYYAITKGPRRLPVPQSQLRASADAMQSEYIMVLSCRFYCQLNSVELTTTQPSNLALKVSRMGHHVMLILVSQQWLSW